MKKNIGDIIKYLLFKNNMKQVDLANAIDIPAPTINRIITGQTKQPYKHSLNQIADFFNIDVTQLTGEKPINNFDDTQQQIMDFSSYKLINIISWSYLDNLDDLTHLPSLPQISVTNTSKNTFALLSPDYSMEPMFKKDAILIFDKDKKCTDHSYILVKLILENIYLFRQIIFNGNRKFLKSLNPDLKSVKLQELTDNDIIIATLVEVRYTL